MSSSPLKPHQSALVTALVASVVVSVIPAVQIFVLPLTYLNTHLHEFCHALVAVLTGGTVQNIQVFANGGGVTLTGGGNAAMTASAGYLGSSLLGAATLAFGRTPQRAQIAMRVMGLVLCLSMAIWVRGDLVGEISGGFWILALFAGAHLLKRTSPFSHASSSVFNYA